MVKFRVQLKFRKIRNINRNAAHLDIDRLIQVAMTRCPGIPTDQERPTDTDGSGGGPVVACATFL